MQEFWNTLSQQLKPRFHELSMYLIAFAFCWVFVFHPEFRLGFYMLFSGFESMSPLFLALGLIVIGGILLSLTHAFIKRKKSATEKAIMGWFVLGTSGVTSFFLGAETLHSRSTIMMIFAVWNILMSVFLLLQMGSLKSNISDREATLAEVFITTVILVIILLAVDLYLRLSWAETLSICIFYSTSIVFITAWIFNYFDLQTPDIQK
jgi:hypothetical protein